MHWSHSSGFTMQFFIPQITNVGSGRDTRLRFPIHIGIRNQCASAVLITLAFYLYRFHVVARRCICCNELRRLHFLKMNPSQLIAPCSDVLAAGLRRQLKEVSQPSARFVDKPSCRPRTSVRQGNCPRSILAFPPYLRSHAPLGCVDIETAQLHWRRVITVRATDRRIAGNVGRLERNCHAGGPTLQ